MNEKNKNKITATRLFINRQANQVTSLVRTFTLFVSLSTSL